MTALIVYVACLAAGVILLWLLGDSMLLWIAARIVRIQELTFRKAVGTVLLITLVTAFILGGLVVVLIWGTPAALTDLSPPRLVALALAALALPVVTVSFLCSGFQIKVREALGLWAAWMGVKALCSTVLGVLMFAGSAVIVAIAQPTVEFKEQPGKASTTGYSTSATLDTRSPPSSDA